MNQEKTRQPNRYTDKSEYESTSHSLVKKLGAVAIAGLIFANVSGIVHASHGADSPDKFGGAVNTDISDVVIEDGARLRFDPYAGNSDNFNLIEELSVDQPITIQTLEGVYVNDDETSDNGAFYGVKTEDIKKAIPGFNDKGDNDGVVWINVQKATPDYKADK